MKRRLLPVLVLLALLVALWPQLADSLRGKGPERPDATPGEDPGHDGQEVRLEGTERATPREEDEAPTEEDRSSASAQTADGAMAEGEAPQPPKRREVFFVFEGKIPDGWAEAKPAQRPHAIRPPAGRRVGGGRGPGPTGHWTRFPPPPPPQGDAELRVRVEDQDGVRLAGADVYLEPPAALGQGSVSFGDLRKIGVTGEDGTLLATALPDGAAVVVANIGNLLNGARGLDAAHGIPVLLTPFRLVEAHVVLPMKSKQLGTVAGRVRGPRGDPLGRVTVIIGFHRVFGDEEGRFEIRSVAAGEVDVQASRSGYRSATARVVVEPSGTTACDLELAWKEEGSLALAGRVTSRAGTPVTGASLYLIDEKGRGTLRSVRTDADGRYAFLSLPDRLAETACRVQAGAHRQGYPSRNVPFEQGLDTANLDIVLPPQMVLLRLHLVDGATGKAVTRCRVEPAQLDESKAPAVRGFMGTHAEGRFEHWFAAGSYRLLIEAPEHAPAELEVSLDPPGAVVTRELEMASLDDNAAPITLVVILRSGDAVVKTATIEVLDAATGAALSRYEGHDGDGRLSMPATAGHRRVRVSSSGYQVEERDVELLIEPATTTLTFDLDSE